MTNFRERREPGSAIGRRDRSKAESKPGFAGRGGRERKRTRTGSYRRRRGGFRTRRRLLGATLLALLVVGALLGMRPLLSGDEVAAGGDDAGQSGGQQKLVSSQDRQDPPGEKAGGASGAASAETAASAEMAATRQAAEPRAEPQKEPPATAGKEKLGEFRTDFRYSDSEARKYNMRLSAGAVDGTVLAPGEVFSMNGNVASLDYREAKVFADGGETLADGGGLCQVTSTVYMAAQLAGLEIVERNAHYTTLPYIRPGFDATVWFGGQGIPELDMKFKNITGSEVLIREYVTDDGILVAEIWGQPTGVEVEMRSEKVFEDLQRGIQWQTYKKVTQDGEVVYDGLIYTDLYSFPPPEAVNSEGYNQVRVGGW